MYSFREAVKEEEVGMEVGGENMTLFYFSGSHHKTFASEDIYEW